MPFSAGAPPPWAGWRSPTTCGSSSPCRLRRRRPSRRAAGTVTGKELVYRTGHSNNCDGACGHLVHVVDGRVTMIGPAAWGTKTVSGAPAPTFHPRICARGLSQISNTYNPDRVKYPYKRVGPRGSGQWERISWDEATSLIAENFTRIQAKYGKTSVWIAPYTGSLGLIEGVVGAGFRFASVIGASAGDSEGDNEGDSATPAGWNYVLVDPTNPANGGGFFTGHESVDFLNAKTIVFWANNVAETSLPDWRVMVDAREQNGTQLISIDPRFTVTCAASDQWLPVRPGADTALIDGIINYVMANNLYDADYIRRLHRRALPGRPQDQGVAAGQGSHRRAPRARPVRTTSCSTRRTGS